MDYKALLSEIFPHKTHEVIENIIRIVEENIPDDPDENKVECMVNLLSDISGNATEIVNNPTVHNLLNEAAAYPDDTWTDTLNKLIDMFPNADISYLENIAKQYSDEPENLEEFVTNAIEKHDYPTMEEHQKKMEGLKEKEQFTKNFKLFEFFKLFPDPHAYFNDESRKHSLTATDGVDLKSHEAYALACLENHFVNLRPNDIQKIFKKCGHNVVRSFTLLKKLPKAFKNSRQTKKLGDPPNNILLLQELAYISNHKQITSYYKNKEDNYQRAKELGLLETCACCFADDLLPEECYFCTNDCIFCKECVRRGAEVVIGEEKVEFPCLADCGNNFSWSTLQMALDPKIFKRLYQKIQIAEITKANIDGLEYCPLCYKFAAIPIPEDKIFHCENCFQNSCRECKHESHIPLRCNEIEYDEDVKIRTFIENKMTEALVRKCCSCGKTFIKNSGCNKITCSCGAHMCYLCGVQVNDYTHFSNSTCPLFTDDNKVHFDNVMKGATAAKHELGVDVNPERLKFDPTNNFAGLV